MKGGNMKKTKKVMLPARVLEIGNALAQKLGVA